MLCRKSIQRIFVPLSLLSLLLLTAAGGTVLHHHRNSTSDDTCQICHLNHYPFEPPPAYDHIPVLAPAGARLEPEEYELSPATFARRLCSRAPPAG
jgi:hypothetical protein